MSQNIDKKNYRLITLLVFLMMYFSMIGLSIADRTTSPLQPDSIVIVSGDNQSGYAGAILPNPLVVKILNVNGKTLPLAEVKFTVVSGGGLVSKISSSYSNEVSTVTDTAGIASVKLKLGLTKEVNRVRVTSGNAPAVEFTATVLNSKPKLNPIGNKEVNEGEVLQFKVTATDADQNDALIFSTSTLWQNATFNSSTGVFTFNPDYNQAGTYLITFFVTDGTDIASEQITITVKNVNRPPILNPIGNRTVNEGVELIIAVSAVDPDGDALTYSVSGMPPGATFNNTQRVFRWKPGYDTVVNAQKKDFIVIFIVNDTSGAIDLESVTITVNDAEPIIPDIRVLPLLPDKQIGLDFESVEVGEFTDRIFQIHNDGNAPLKLISIAETDNQFKLLTYIKTHSNIIDPIDPHIIKLLDEASILALIGSNEQFINVEYSPNDPSLTINYPDLNPGECLLIRARFKPLSTGQKTARFIIRSDDPDESVVFMNLKGIGTLTPDIRVSSDNINFGDVEVGKNSDKLLTIFNDGKGVLNINSITSDDPQFTVLGYSNVNPNSSIVVTIRFTPNSIGNKASVLRINSNDPDESLVLVNLQGTGFRVPAPDINLSTTNINFGEVQVGKSLTKNFQIQNLGDALLQITSITSSNAQFTVTGVANVPAGAFITISVKFTPTSSGSKAGVITILSNDPDEPNITLTVQGIGVVLPTPNIKVSPSVLNFGDVEVGKTAIKSFNIYNDGNATLEIYRITTNDNQFTILDDPNVPAGGIAVIPVEFKPTSLGQKEAVITISSNDPDEPTKTLTAKGKGISPPAPDIRLSNTSLDFGDVQVGESKVLYINIFNDGNLPLVLNSMTTNNEQFAVIWDSQNVPVGEYITISIRFSPVLTGLKTATLTIKSNDPDEQTVTVSLQGRGYEVPVPDIEIYPFSIDFGSVEVGKSLIKTFRIYNRGNAPLQITSITSSNSQFTTISSATILGGTSLLVQVNFAPISLGSKTATLTLVSNDPDEAVTTVSLYGDGVYPGYVNVGVWSKVQQANIVNDLYDVFFINENRGWAVGYNGTIINSTNGGTAWTFQNSGTARTLNSVFFVDQLTGWAVGQYGTILKTTNGGLSWNQIGYSIANTLWSIKFINPIKGWSVGEFGSVWTINDGIWSYQNSNQTFDLFDVDFVNYNQGWAVGSYGTIIRTIDGGQTWTPQQSMTTEALLGLDFVNANEGWAVGTNGTILRTINGGLTWVRQNSNVNFETLYDVDFIDSNYGWIVGNNGIILHTIDGGTTWVRIDSGTNKALRSVYFTNPETGWIVGANGTILKYMPYYPTYISSVTVTGSPAKLGGVIRVTATGQARNEARFSIAGAISNVPMQETTPGTYVGTYTAVENVNVWSAVVSVILTNKYGNSAIDTSQRVTIDTIATITSAEVSPNIAKAGDVIKITVYGEAGSSVRWTIENVVTDLVMTEVTNGKYIGEYKVLQGTNVSNAKVIVKLTDAFGNVATKEAGTVTIDTVAQITSVTVSGSPAKFGEPIVIVMVGEANGKAKFTIGDVVVNSPMTESQAGVYIGNYVAPKGVQVYNVAVTVSLTDVLGNTTTKNAENVTIDTESKIALITVKGSPGKAGEKITVELQGEPNGSAKFSIAGVISEQIMPEQPIGSGKYYGSWTITSNVNVTDAILTVVHIDALGNIATDTSNKVTIDNIPPTISSPNVSGSPGKAGGTITISMTGEPNARARFNIVGVFEENMTEQPAGSGKYIGKYVIRENINVTNAVVVITLLDSVGNYVTDTSLRVTIDNTPPNISSVKVSGSPGKAGEKITVNAIGEPNCNATFSIAGVVTNQSMTEQPSNSGNYVGIYTIQNGVNVVDAVVTVTLSDQVGNTKSDSTQKVTIDTIPPKITALDVSGSPSKIGEVIIITIITDKNSIVKFSIAGLVQNVSIEESKDAQGTYIGRYTVVDDKFIPNATLTISVSDSIGNVTTDTSKTITIVPSWDVDRDGTVGNSDILMISKQFGQKVTGKNDADVNKDGIINILDLAIVSKHYGESAISVAPPNDLKLSPEQLKVLKNVYKSIDDNDPDILIVKELLDKIIRLNTPNIARSELLQNYPNPFNPETWIPFRLSEPNEVTISIYTPSGQLVRKLDLGYKDIGDYTDKNSSAYWDGRNEFGEKVSSGVYFYSIKAGKFQSVKKMIIEK